MICRVFSVLLGVSWGPLGSWLEEMASGMWTRPKDAVDRLSGKFWADTTRLTA